MISRKTTMKININILGLFLFLLISNCQTSPENSRHDHIMKFVDAFEESIVQFDTTFLDQVISVHFFEERTMRNTKEPEKKISYELKKKFDINKIFVGKAFYEGRNYPWEFRVTRIYYDKSDRAHVVVRILNTKDNSWTVWDMLLWEFVETGTIKIMDIYNYATGEWLSDEIRNKILWSEGYHHVSDKNKDYDSGLEYAYEDYEGKLPLFKEEIKNGNFREAEEMFKTFPKVVRESRIGQNFYQSILYAYSSDAFVKGAYILMNKYANEHRYVAFNGITACYIDEDYERTLAYLAVLYEFIGEDPYLMIKEGAVMYSKGNYQEAADFFDNVISEYNFPLAYMWFFSCMVELDKIEEGLAKLEELNIKFQLSKSDIWDLIPELKEGVEENPLIISWYNESAKNM